MISDSEIPTSSPAEPHHNSAPQPAAELRALTSEDLFQGQREILIKHAGETYRLRLTRNGKLILNK